MSGALLAAARAVAAVTPWATVLVLVFLLGHRLARGHVAARTFRLVWLVLALRLAVLHNLYFYNELAARIRQALDEGTFADFRARYSGNLEKRA